MTPRRGATAALLAAGLAAASAGCSTAEIYPPDDPDLHVIATWGSAAEERSYNGASIDADAAQLPVSGVKVACHEAGCFVGVTSDETMKGPGVEPVASDAVLAFDGEALSARLSSLHEDYSFVLEAIAAAPDGANYAFGGRYQGIPARPFGSELTFPDDEGTALFTADGAGVTAGLRLGRTNVGVAPELGSALGGLLFKDPTTVIGALRYRDELGGFDAVSPADPPETLCEGVSGNNDYRGGAMFAARLGTAQEAACSIIPITPKPPMANIFNEALGVARSTTTTIHVGHYVDKYSSGDSFGVTDQDGATTTALPYTGGPYWPFVVLTQLRPDLKFDVTSAKALQMPGALEAVAMRADSTWLACGTAAEGPTGTLPASCEGVEAGSLLVAYGRFDIEGCVDVAAKGRCRAVIESPAGFVIAAVDEAEGAPRTTLIEIGSSREIVDRVERAGVVVDSLALLGDDVLLGGSFTGTFDQQDPTGGVEEWDLFLARWVR